MTKHKTRISMCASSLSAPSSGRRTPTRFGVRRTRNILRQISNAGGVATRPPRKRLSLSGGLSRSLIGEWPTPDWYKPCPALNHARPGSTNCWFPGSGRKPPRFSFGTPYNVASCCACAQAVPALFTVSIAATAARAGSARRGRHHWPSRRAPAGSGDNAASSSWAGSGRRAARRAQKRYIRGVGDRLRRDTPSGTIGAGSKPTPWCAVSSLPHWGKLQAHPITRADVKTAMAHIEAPSSPTKRWPPPRRSSRGR